MRVGAEDKMGSVARGLLVALAAFVSVETAGPAQAQEGFGYGAPVARSGDASLRRHRNRVWVDLPFFTGAYAPGTDAIAFAPYVGARIRAAEALEIELGWGFPYVSLKDTMTGETNGRFSVGNPYVGLSFASTAPGREIHAGVGMALPVASIPDVSTPPTGAELLDAGLAQAGYWYALGMWGLWDLWLYSADTFSLVLPASIDADVGHALRAGGSVALDVAFPVRTTGGRQTELFFQLDGYVGYQAAESFGFGVRLALVLAPTVDTGDRAQLSLEPFIKADIDQGFIRVGLLMNLDRPFGFAFDEGRVWALRTTIGARF